MGPDGLRDLLARYEIRMPRQELAGDADEAAQAAARIGGAIALKGLAEGLLHRSDVGAVQVGLGTSEVRSAALRMAERVPGLSGYLVQSMARPGIEMIVGEKVDPVFGPVVLVGFGGIWVETLGDAAIRLAPIDEADAGEMLAELRAATLLSGGRGQDPADVASLARILVSVGRLIVEHEWIGEIDLNPVIVRPDGAVVVDAKVVAREGDRDHRALAAPERIARMLEPETIAVVGASSTRAKQGGRLFHYLIKHGFPGRLYAVNPARSEVMGRPSVASIDELPETPDLVCVAVPADTVTDVLAACERRGVPSAIVYTSGFAETGEDGAAAERALADVLRRGSLRICGPNTAGVVNAERDLCAAIGMAFEVERMPRGDVSLLTQSGALGSALLSRCWANGIGFSKWIATGNAVDLDLTDYLNYLVDDAATRVIVLFIEAVRDGRAFVEVARRGRQQGKLILAYKTGASQAGQRAVRSHTASLAGDDAVYDAALRAAGVVRVHDLQGMLDAAVALSWQPLPRGRRVAVIAASGGACSVIADECARNGLELPAFAPSTQRRIAELLPSFGVSQNPIDMTMQITVDPQIVGRVAETVLADEGIDALVVLLTTNADPPAFEVAQGVVRAARSSTKPVIVTRLGAEFLAPTSVQHYRESRIPLFVMPEQAVRALRVMAEMGRPHGLPAH